MNKMDDAFPFEYDWKRKCLWCVRQKKAVHLCWAWGLMVVQRGQCEGGGGGGGGGGVRHVVSSCQITWASTHLSLLPPVLLCQTLLLQINKCWTNFSLLNPCQPLHNNEGRCCQRMCPVMILLSGRTMRKECFLAALHIFLPWTVLALALQTQESGNMVQLSLYGDLTPSPRHSYRHFFLFWPGLIIQLTLISQRRSFQSVFAREAVCIQLQQRERINLSSTWQSANIGVIFNQRSVGLSLYISHKNSNTPFSLASLQCSCS